LERVYICISYIVLYSYINEQLMFERYSHSTMTHI